MPLDGSGNHTLPAGSLVTTGQTSAASQHNTPLEDISTALTACIKANGSKAFTSEQLVHGNPSNVLGIAPKQYVDATAASTAAAMKVKGSVLCVATTNLTLSAEQTIDGQLTSASRVLVAGQTAPAENGIYVTGAGGWARATDLDAWTEAPGAVVAVEAGTAFADTVWLCTADAGGTLETTAITFRRIDNQWLANAQTDTTYTVVKDDHHRYVTHSNASAIATALAQATGNFARLSYISHNLGAGANTITPTTSTINGVATLVQKTGDAHLIAAIGGQYRAIPLGLTHTQVTALTEDATGAVTDFFVTEDVSAGLLKKMLISTLQTLLAASQAQMETGTSNDVFVSPGRQSSHPAHPKAWAMFDGSVAGTNAPTAGHNVTSVTRNAAGNYTLNLAITMSSVNYAWYGNARGTVATAQTSVGADPSDTKTTTALQVRVRRTATDAAQDSTDVCVFIFGDI